MIEVYQRTDLVIQRQVLDAETGDPLQLSGASVSLIAKRAGQVVMSKVTGDGITITDAADGRIEITLDAQDTDLPSGRYATELLIEDADGNRYVAGQSTLTILTSLHDEVI